MRENSLVSIIMPAYNSEKYISETLESVLKQTYQFWELQIIDDASTDRTIEIIQTFAKKDDRIKFEVLNENSGAAVARNRAIEKAEGKYLAFLDSDDFWSPDKLSKQLDFMEENNYLFTSTDFNEIDEGNNLIGNTTKAHKKLDYDGVLKYCPGNSTVIYNCQELGKFYVPDIKKRNDFAMWLQVIKKAKFLYGLDEVLTTYRIREGSLSKNKTNLVKYQWKVYREIENLSFIKSIYLLLHKVLSVLTK